MVNILPDITYVSATVKRKCSELEWCQRTEKNGEAVVDRTGTHLKGRMNRSGLWTRGRDEGWESHNGWFQVHLKGISIFKKYIHLCVYFQCVWTCSICVFMCMGMHVEARGWHWYLLLTLCFIFGTGSLLNHRQASQFSNPTPSHPVPSTGTTDQYCHARLLHGC